jgi:predicted metal-dependent TIM-barrel fold hydrolase
LGESEDDLKKIYFSASRETLLRMAEEDGLKVIVALGLNPEEDTDLTTKKIEDIALEKKFVPKQIVID